MGNPTLWDKVRWFIKRLLCRHIYLRVYEGEHGDLGACDIYTCALCGKDLFCVIKEPE